MRNLFTAILLALVLPATSQAASVFEATPTDPGGFDLTAAPGSSFPGNHAPFVGNIFGGEGFAISGVESFSGVLADGRYMTSLSFEVFQPTGSQTLEGCNTTCVKSTFALDLFDGLTNVGAFTFTPTEDAIFLVETFGPISKFNRFVVTETEGSNDNEFFANFKADLAPIPLPAGAWMMLSTLGLLALRRRRAAGDA